MRLSFEHALIAVWRQDLAENAEVVVLGTERFPVRLLSCTDSYSAVVLYLHSRLSKLGF